MEGYQLVKIYDKKEGRPTKARCSFCGGPIGTTNITIAEYEVIIDGARIKEFDVYHHDCFDEAIADRSE